VKPLRVSAIVAISLSVWATAVSDTTAIATETQQLVAVPTAEARNLRVEHTGAGISIQYDLAGTSTTPMTVRLEATVLPDEAYDLIPRTMRGDVGEGVVPGPNKQIVWDAAKDVEEVQWERFKFRLVTSAASGTTASAADRSTVTVFTAPDGAMIALDGRSLGLAPLEIRNVSSGRHRLTARKEGYAEMTRVLDVKAGEPLRIEIPLATAAEQTQASKGSGLKWVAVGGGAAAAAGAALALSGGGSTSPSAPASTATVSSNTTPTTTTPTPPPNRAPTVTCGSVVFGGLRAMVATDVAIVSATRLQFVIAAASDVDGDALSFTIAYGNGVSTTGTYSAANTTTEYIYPGAGVYSPSVTVRDARGGEAGCRFATVTTSTIAGDWTGPPTAGRISSRFTLSQSGLNVTGNYFEGERTAASALQGTLSSRVAGRKDGTLSLTVAGNYGGQLSFLLEPSDDLRTYRGTFTYRGTTMPYEMRK